MIDKKLYLQLKRDIRCLCRPNLLKLCDDMDLNETERKLLVDFYDNQTVTYTTFDLHISATTYHKYMKELFCKINDYKNTH